MTTGLTAIVEPPLGLSDYAVFSIQADGTAVILPVRISVSR
jgi:hypothetical protein